MAGQVGPAETPAARPKARKHRTSIFAAPPAKATAAARIPRRANWKSFFD
jgi:hypothetical protein